MFIYLQSYDLTGYTTNIQYLLYLVFLVYSFMYIKGVKQLVQLFYQRNVQPNILQYENRVPIISSDTEFQVISR